MQFIRTDPVVYDAFYSALEAQGPDRIETYYDRDTDRIDGNGSEIIKALVETGWHHVPWRPRDAEHAYDWLYERAEGAAAKGLPLKLAIQAVMDGYSSIEADRIIAADLDEDD